MYLIFYQILILFCLIQLSLLDRGDRRHDRVRPRRVLENIQENLGRIHEALHELGSELPADNQRRFRNRQRFGRSLNWFNRGPLFPPHPFFNHYPPPPPHNPFFRPGFDRPRWGPRFGGPGFGRPGRPFRRRRPHPPGLNDRNNPNSYEYETTPYDYPDDYQTPPPYDSPDNNRNDNNNYNNQNDNNRNDNNRNDNNNNYYNNGNRDTIPTNTNVVHSTSKPYSPNASANNDRNTGTRKPNTNTPDYNNDQSINAKSELLSKAEKICGLKLAARIVGGKETTRHPWVVALIKNDGTTYCGGVLLTARHVLTAAHCLKSQTPKDMFVRLGEYDFSDEDSEKSEDHKVERFIIHSNYDKLTHVNDIAILRLKEPTPFTQFIRPVCLGSKRKDYTHEIATVVGYGSDGTNRSNQPRLREVSVPIWKHEQCEEAYGTNMTLGQMCAGFKEGGKDSCQGDSGGPLMINQRQKWQVVGIVSFGIGCGQRGYPGVYTRVNQYLSWIISNVN